MSQGFTMEFDMGNSAFEGDDAGFEIARILRQFADVFEGLTRQQLADGDYPGKVTDINGNCIGDVNLYVDEEEDEDDSALYTSVRNATRWMDVADQRRFLESVCGIQTYDHETEYDLTNAIVENIKDGTTTLDDLEGFTDHS